MAKSLVAREIANASRDSKIALFEAHDRLQRTESAATLQAVGGRSRLVDALTDLTSNYDSGALAAVIVLTDGAQNGGDGTDLEALAATGVPVHPVGIGPPGIPGDVELSELVLPLRAAPDTQVTARLVIRHTDADEVRVRVLDGESVLATETVDLDPTTPIMTKDIAFASGAAGLKEITVELDAAASDRLPATMRSPSCSKCTGTSTGRCISKASRVGSSSSSGAPSPRTMTSS